MVIAVKDILANQAASRSPLSAKYRMQLLAVLTSHIITLVHGIAIGWLSPILITLQSPDKTPLTFVVNVQEASWVGACWGFGALTGSLCCGYLTEKIGRKYTMICVAVPVMISWLLVFFAQNVVYLYVSRTLAGWAGGVIFQVMPLFSSEIADTCVRGAISAVMMSIWSIGILSGYILSSYLNYFVVPCIAVCFPVVFMILISMFPETPPYLLKTGKLTEAERSYRFYKRIKSNNDPELLNFETLKTNLYHEENVSKISWMDYKTKEALRGFLVAITMGSCCHLMGGFSLTQYFSIIFHEAGTLIDGNVCTIVMGAVQIVGAVLGVTVVDSLGRRRVFLTSVFGMTTGWFIFGIYLLFTTNEMRAEFSWAPLVIMIYVVFTGSFGMVSLFTVIMVEAFPAKIRSRAIVITMLIANIVLTIQLKLYLIEIVYLGMANTMFLSCFAGVICFVLLYYNLQETKDKEINYV